MLVVFGIWFVIASSETITIWKMATLNGWLVCFCLCTHTQLRRSRIHDVKIVNYGQTFVWSSFIKFCAKYLKIKSARMARLHKCMYTLAFNLWILVFILSWLLSLSQFQVWLDFQESIFIAFLSINFIFLFRFILVILIHCASRINMLFCCCCYCYNNNWKWMASVDLWVFTVGFRACCQLYEHCSGFLTQS